jgi:hypothetical protein
MVICSGRHYIRKPNVDVRIGREVSFQRHPNLCVEGYKEDGWICRCINTRKIIQRDRQGDKSLAVWLNRDTCTEIDDIHRQIHSYK